MLVYPLRSRTAHVLQDLGKHATLSMDERFNLEL